MPLHTHQQIRAGTRDHWAEILRRGTCTTRLDPIDCGKYLVRGHAIFDAFRHFLLSRCSEYFTKVVRMNHKRRVMSDRANATSTYGSLSVLSRGSQTVRSATDARNQLTLCLSGVRLWTMWAWMFLARCRDSTQSPCPHACCAHRHAMATTERGSLAAAAAGGSACVICGAVTHLQGLAGGLRPVEQRSRARSVIMTVCCM